MCQRNVRIFCFCVLFLQNLWPRLEFMGGSTGKCIECNGSTFSAMNAVYAMSRCMMTVHNSCSGCIVYYIEGVRKGQENELCYITVTEHELVA